jgi:ectoine hydroxylase-related dioxygenase (phytanoyl-CoA dioxygenase family)
VENEGEMTEAKYIGNFEGVKNGLLTGWVKRTDTDEPVEISILINGKVLDTFPANTLRKDLFNLGIGRGLHGFSWAPPEEYVTADEVEIEILVPGNYESKILDQRRHIELVQTSITEEAFWANAPWVDAPDAEEVLQARIKEGRYSLDDYGPLRDFIRQGYCVLPGAIAEDLIDRFLGDIDKAFIDRPKVYTRWPADEAGVYLNKITDEETLAEIRATSFRFNSFHNTSDAAAEISLHPTVVDLVSKIFDGDIIATQSLTFENTTQQHEHMDFAFVHQEKPAYLVGAWVACEDIHSDSGPLFYYPGSHKKVPFFQFGGGNIFSFGDRQQGVRFSQYLKEESEKRGIKKKTFLAQKGDVILWHSALIHGGTKRSRRITRKSYVTHYTKLDLCSRDKRTPALEPILIERNGGYYHQWQDDEHVEGFYPL